jgi:hypothetical protein
MTEKELGKALLQLDMAPAAAPDPRQLTRNILERDQRRIRLLAAVSVFFWLLTVAGIGVLLWFYFLHVSPRLGAYVAGRRQPQQDADIWLMVSDATAKILLACLIALLLAAVSTVVLVLASRRATLRQINANLVEISGQLKLLLQHRAPAAPEATGTA